MGYIDLERFMELPTALPSYVNAVRAADSIKTMRSELRETTDSKTRKKLTDNLNKLEAFFR